MTKLIVFMVLFNVLTTWLPIDEPTNYWNDISSDDSALCIVYASTDTCPIVFFADGEDLLKKNARLYHDSNGRIYFEDNDVEKFEESILKQIDQQPFFRYAAHDNSYLGQISLEKIHRKKSWEDFIELNEIYCNRKNLTPSVEHRQYTINEQAQIPAEYIDHLKKLLLDNNLSRTPPVITEIWRVDLDRDGKNEVFVKSCNSNYNRHTSKEEIARATDHDIKDMDGIGTYLVLSLYSETLGQSELSEFYAPIDEDIKNFSKKNLLTQGYEEEWIEQPDMQYQYDDTGYIRLMPIYAGGETVNLSCFFCQPLFLDTNGDGLYDLILRTGSDYTNFALYLVSHEQLLHEYDLIMGP